MIFSVETGVFVEYSISAISPYDNYFGDLFYGGPTFYYYLANKQLYHTILEERFSELDIENFSSSSIALYNELSRKGIRQS